ncbi:MAG: DUF1343 domain-containing protein [Bacteroidota bacterium]|nr:DUF1343 domain-containing protein [Bacteroidota bacterium]
MTKIFIFILFFFTNLFGIDNEKKIIVGAERIDQYKDLIKGKSIALLVNHTSVVKGVHLIDTLSELGYNINKIFSPEHGFRGTIERGKKVFGDTLEINEKKIPIVSMYGKNRIPTYENMKGIDVVVFDIQDVGVRFYTYISAMHNMMKICGELGIEFIVLDRPNPNGNYIDGPVLDLKFQSYIGMHEIPIVHGCTVGELAKMILGEKWIENGENLNLKIVKVKNWDHTKNYIVPIRPSPNLPNHQSILLYPSLCLFEQTIVSIGRGTDFPFQVIGHPNSSFSNFKFTPRSVSEESKPKLEGQESFGIDLRDIEVKKELNIKYLIDFYNDLKDKKDDFFGKYFYRIAGNKILENQIISGVSENQIRLSWKNDINSYKKIRKKYLLYKDFE